MAATQRRVRGYGAWIREGNATLDPTTDGYRERTRRFGVLRRRLLAEVDPAGRPMGRVMASFEAGLFVGGGACDAPRDHLELERWFRWPKGHERRIHGRSHAGVRLVQEGRR